jgi:hypothetical protein
MASQTFPERDLKPFTQEELIKKAMKSEEDYKAGRYSTLEEFKEKYKAFFK